MQVLPVAEERLCGRSEVMCSLVLFKQVRAMVNFKMRLFTVSAFSLCKQTVQGVTSVNGTLRKISERTAAPFAPELYTKSTFQQDLFCLAVLTCLFWK